MTATDWVTFLGPGGLIALLWTVSKVVEAWRRGRDVSVTNAIHEWQEICEQRDKTIAAQLEELGWSWAMVEYWRSRAGRAEFNLHVNGLPIPPSGKEPRRPQRFQRPKKDEDEEYGQDSP